MEPRKACVVTGRRYNAGPSTRVMTLPSITSRDQGRHVDFAAFAFVGS
jgi:hypothetical protein